MDHAIAFHNYNDVAGKGKFFRRNQRDGLFKRVVEISDPHKFNVPLLLGGTFIFVANQICERL